MNTFTLKRKLVWVIEDKNNDTHTVTCYFQRNKKEGLAELKALRKNEKEYQKSLGEIKNE